MPATIALTPVDDERNRAAREAARRRVSWPANLAPETVDFESEGYLLIAGAELDIRRAAARLAGQLPGITLLVTERSSAEEDPDLEAIWEATRALPCHQATGALRLEGYLGRFHATLASDAEPVDLARATQARPCFDLVLDLGQRPLLAKVEHQVEAGARLGGPGQIDRFGIAREGGMETSQVALEPQGAGRLMAGQRPGGLPDGLEVGVLLGAAALGDQQGDAGKLARQARGGPADIQLGTGDQQVALAFEVNGFRGQVGRPGDPSPGGLPGGSVAFIIHGCQRNGSGHYHFVIVDLS